MSAQAMCAWGDGPDILVSVDRKNASGFGWTPYAKDHPSGAFTEGSFGLTIDESLALAQQLVQSAMSAARLSAGYDEAARHTPDGMMQTPPTGPAARKLLVRMLNTRGCTVLDDKDGNLVVVLPDHLTPRGTP